MVNYALFASVFVIATCGLVYELIAGTLASYLIGDSIFQFSTVIGVYLFAMGIGSYLSRYITKGLIHRFIQIEIILGIAGGFAAAALMVAFSFNLPFRFSLYLSVLSIGTLVGLEIPLLLRILKNQLEFRHLVSQILTLDYVGALFAALLFPLVLLPKLGLLRAGMVFGLANVGIGWLAIRLFKHLIPAVKQLRLLAAGATLLLLAGVAGSTKIYSFAEEGLYADEVIYAKSSPYQRIILTKWKQDVRLYLNDNLQFSTFDEYRYHETLVHPGLSAVEHPDHVLVMGGGDGLAVREILKQPLVKDITLVDLDPMMTHLFSTNPLLLAINKNSLRDHRVHVINADGFKWLDEQNEFFDFVIVDLPDPTNYSVGKLYTTTFYRLIRHHLRPGGIIVVQATSPMFARKSYWTIEKTIKEAGFQTIPYHVYVPSFGEWGFVMGTQGPFRQYRNFPEGLKFLSPNVYNTLLDFPNDMARVETVPNTLDDQLLVRLHDDEWARITK